MSCTHASLRASGLCGSVRGIKCVIQRAIDANDVPGAVLEVTYRGRTLCRQAYGRSTLVGRKERMKLGTIFDLASLTKVVATTTAVAMLVDRGDLHVDAPAHAFLPHLRSRASRRILIRHLLTHTSGLPPYHNYLANPPLPPEEIVADICTTRLRKPPGQAVIYSDLGFILLGVIVETVAGLPLGEFCQREIFEPLGMARTCFNPSPILAAECAPTATRRGKLLRGEVHDENAFALGGVAGHAGLFSCASDLSTFAQMLLARGRHARGRLMSSQTVREFLQPQHFPDGASRAFGWDVATGSTTSCGQVLPPRCVGHTGFTGTSVWLDPVSHASIVLLTNRVHPHDKGDATRLRAEVGSVVGAVVSQNIVLPPTPVETGLDVLMAGPTVRLAGRRVGIITNHTAIAKSGEHLIDLCLERDDVDVAAIFSPEHGLAGKLDQRVPSGQLSDTAIPVHSLYGDHTAPTPAMLHGLDLLLFDIQDVGVRFYTYAATMGLCLEAAARARIPMVVLDRPNPISGIELAGPWLRRSKRSLVAFHTVPLRHGLTMGELARLAQRRIKGKCALDVVPMRGWRRGMFFDETGLPWVNPSPNMRSLKQALLYPAIGMIEFSNISVGRGTDTPFEILGAPWIDPIVLADALNRSELPGVTFTPTWFEPRSIRHEGRRCGGVYLMLNHRTLFQPDLTGVAIAQTLCQLYPSDYDLGATNRLVCDASALADLKRGKAPERIARGWRSSHDEFLDSVQEILLYT